MKQFVIAVLLCLAPAAAGAQVVVKDAWARSTVPGQSVGGAYMRIESSVPVSLVAASSSAAKSVEIHESSMEGGVMRMRAVRKIDLGPGKPVELKPGGYHIMLMELARPLAKGGKVPLRLTFEQQGKPAQSVDVVAEVRDVMAGGGAMSGMGDRHDMRK
jgi:copper(I)-binding protein